MKMEVHKVPGDLKLIGVRKKSLNWNLSAEKNEEAKTQLWILAEQKCKKMHYKFWC